MTGYIRYDYTPVWKAPSNIVSPCSTAEMRPTVAAAAINSEQIVAVWEEVGSRLKYSTWSGSWLATPGSLPDYPEDVTPLGSPVLISPSGVSWEVYLRGDLGGEGRIYLSTTENGTTTNWQALPGVEGEASAASDPAVVLTGTQHKLVFYRDNHGDIRFTEYQSGIWRSAPVALPEQETNILLPLVVKMNTASSSSLQPEYWHDLNSNEQVTSASPSELSAISRNENHAAVFFVDENNRLWVNEWTNHNRSDWSDTDWVVLMENVIIEKPAVTSRHINHLAVAVRDTDGIPYIIEWTQNLNDTGEAGWKEPYALGKILDSPLAITSSSLDSLSIFGTDSAGDGLAAGLA